MKGLALGFVLLLAACGPRKPEPGVKLSGRVEYSGPRRETKVISMDAEADCEKLHAEPVEEQLIAVATDGGLANAFVYIQAGLEGVTFGPATGSVVLEQKGCQFVPRVLALRTGQTLTVKNADPVSHNIHPTPKENRDWNQQQPPGAPDLQRRFARPEIMVPVKCNVHNWMRSYIGVLDHPFLAVTDAKGEFAWPDLPPGSYTLAVWHETLGALTQKLTVAPGGPAAVTLRYLN